jgi:hypothetical protein
VISSFLFIYSKIFIANQTSCSDVGTAAVELNEMNKAYTARE